MTRTISQCCLAVALLAAISTPVLAQAPAAAPAAAGFPPPGTLTEDESGYKYYAPYINPKMTPKQAGEARISEGRGRTQVWQILGGGSPLNDNRAAFDFYYNKILFPSLTQTTDAGLTALPEERQKLFRDHLEKCTGDGVHQILKTMVYERMEAIVKDNFHPAVRYNAMLVISNLNDVEPVRVGANKTTPEPMMGALPFIIEQFTKPDNTDAIRVASLLGLVRHLEWDNFRGATAPFTPAIIPAQKAAIVKALLDLSQQKAPPAGRNEAGHEWFRRRAIEGLTHAGYYKVDAEVAAAMDALLKDETQSLAIRCAAATALGNMTYVAPVKLETTPTAKELGYLAPLACHKELTRVADLNKAEIERLTRLQSSSSGGGSGGGFDGSTASTSSGGMTMPGGGSMTPRLGPGTGSAEGAYTGPRPGGSVRPRVPALSAATRWAA